MDVVLFGPPGAGKGTQATAICAALGVPQVATGDIFRRHLKEGTELGKLAKGYMDRGALVPDEVVFGIVASRVSDPDCAGGVLFDGFPRTVAQAGLLANWLAERDRRIDRVVNLEVPDAAIVARLGGRRTCTSCGATWHVVHAPTAKPGVCDRCGSDVIQRPDDREDTVQSRLRTYHEQTAPVVAWLRTRTTVVDVAGDRPISEVEAACRAAVGRP